MEGRAKIIIPSLLYYEVGNILLFGRSRPPMEQAVEAIAELFALPLEAAPPALVNANVTLRLASLHRISYYDATYVALAEMFDCRLVTADRRLVERTRDIGQVRLLGQS
jgi:predicted nucleic acid-binding protein